MTPDVFKNNFAGLGEYFNKPQTQAVAQIYWRKLKHLTDEQFLFAVDKCIDDCTFFPKVTEIISKIPKPIQIENKSSLSWCQNTQALLEKYRDNV